MPEEQANSWPHLLTHSSETSHDGLIASRSSIPYLLCLFAKFRSKASTVDALMRLLPCERKIPYYP
jgi:hypothetical protein